MIFPKHVKEISPPYFLEKSHILICKSQKDSYTCFWCKISDPTKKYRPP